MNVKPPAFQFYVKDFLHGTLDFTALEVGAYILLLCEQWDRGFIKDTDVSRVARIDEKKIEKVLLKFNVSKNKLKNRRLEKIRSERKNYSKMQSQKGLQGAKKRWQRPLSGHDPAIANDSSASASLTASAKLVADPFFSMFRRTAGDHISDEELITEIGKFKNRYPNKHPNVSGALVNAWVARIGTEKPTKTEMTY